jgi:hypothetical protein
MNIWSPEHGQTVQAYNGPIEAGPPFPPPNGPSITMHTVFSQLKWSVLDAPSRVEMFSLDANDRPQWTYLFTNAIAEEPATTPSNSRLQIRLEPLQSWENWQQSETEPPDLLLIENNDDQPVSVRQLIQAVHDYAMPLRQALCRCCDTYEEVEDDARFYSCPFGGVREATPENPCPEVELHVISDTDEDNQQLEGNLQLIETLYHRRHTSG